MEPGEYSAAACVGGALVSNEQVMDKTSQRWHRERVAESSNSQRVLCFRQEVQAWLVLGRLAGGRVVVGSGASGTEHGGTAVFEGERSRGRLILA